MSRDDLGSRERLQELHTVHLDDVADGHVPNAGLAEGRERRVHAAEANEDVLRDLLWGERLRHAPDFWLHIQANSAKLRVPAGPPPPPPSNVRVAKGPLRASQFQELADRLGEISKIAADDNLKLGVQIEIGGAKPPAAETKSKVNKVLKDVDPNLELKSES